MKFSVLSLFPDLFSTWLESGLVGQAFKKNLFAFEAINPRAFAKGLHQGVDDKIYGGGDGMVQSFPPWSQAIESVGILSPPSKVVFLTPQGRLWNQTLAQQWLREESHLVFVCGRYAGFDERLIFKHADEEISVGDYVVNGGELPAQIVMETLIRGLPGVLGHEDSFSRDSLSEGGLLEAPQFTRPQEVEGLKVPSFLLEGHHEKIESMRWALSVVRTSLRRPDLLKKAGITSSELKKAKEEIQKLSPEDQDVLGVKL